ncbi:MAG: hypothetical protein HKN79_01845 [Flavobacteriales bacterium]|nr:hypothetical protein [Flavobacteriales bacterium]
MSRSPVLDFSFGSLFPPNMHILGMGAMLGGLISLISEVFYVGPIFILAGAYLFFAKSGVQVRPKEKQYREYSHFIFRSGRWRSYADYSDMALLRGREGFRAYSRGMVELSDSEGVWDLYLLKPGHRSKLILKRCRTMEEGQKAGEELAEELGVRWTVFSPMVSKKTRMRRR